VVVAILGFTGWFVWHAKQNTDKSLDNANKSSSTAWKASRTDKGQLYLPITGFGIKLPLTNEQVQDISFFTTSSIKDVPPNTTAENNLADFPGQVELFSKKISTMCGSAQDNQSLFLVTRDDSTTPVASKAIASFRINHHNYTVVPMSTPANNGCKDDASKKAFNTTYNGLLAGLKKAVSE